MPPLSFLSSPLRVILAAAVVLALIVIAYTAVCRAVERRRIRATGPVWLPVTALRNRDLIHTAAGQATVRERVIGGDGKVLVVADRGRLEYRFEWPTDYRVRVLSRGTVTITGHGGVDELRAALHAVTGARTEGRA